jgi:hypothetical protein
MMPLAKPHKNHEGSELTLNERQRRDLMHSIASCGETPVADLPELSDAERCKWLFWNLHENLEHIRSMEPTLQGRVTSLQFTVLDSSRTVVEGGVTELALEKRLDLSCHWLLGLTYPGYPDEITYSVGDGWINLIIADQVPTYLMVHEGQRAYLDADHTTYPSQLFLEGWISNQIWQEMRPHLWNANPTCRTDVVLLDNVLFPVKQGFDFVQGPAGSIGVMNVEFRAFSHPTERRSFRRGEPRHRT